MDSANALPRSVDCKEQMRQVLGTKKGTKKFYHVLHVFMQFTILLKWENGYQKRQPTPRCMTG